MKSAFAALALLLAGPAAAGGMGENLIPFATPTPPPDHPITLESGAKVALADYEGRVAVAVFWATWCEVCEEEMPEIAALARRRDPEELAVLPISVDEGAPFVKVRAYLEERDLEELPVMVDVAQTLFHAVGAYATPTTVIVDRFGHVVAAYIGEADWESPAVNAYLDALVAAETPDASRAALARFTAAE